MEKNKEIKYRGIYETDYIIQGENIKIIKPDSKVFFLPLKDIKSIISLLNWISSKEYAEKEIKEILNEKKYGKK